MVVLRRVGPAAKDKVRMFVSAGTNSVRIDSVSLSR